jgi:hypothetical protein
MGRKVNTLENILSRAIRDEEKGCLLYITSLNKKGYPLVSFNNKTYKASRLVYEMLYGVIKDEQEIDHTCYERRCVERTHLRALTHRENVLHSKTYDEKRNHRLRTLIGEHPQVKFFPILLTLNDLGALWHCGSIANVRKCLRTMSSAFPNEFCYERFKAGRGRKPALYAIGIQPSLIDTLLNEDAQRETPAEDILTFAA